MGETTSRPSDDLLIHKGSNRIQVNNILSAVCVTALSVILTLYQNQPGAWIVAQLAMAVPCLVTSSLAYAKLCYRQTEERSLWDGLGWFTHSVGYSMILNATALLLYRSNYQATAWLFLGITAGLFVLYSMLDVVASRRRSLEKSWKLVFYLGLMGVGAALPIVLGWI